MSLTINNNITALNAWRNLNNTDRAMSSTMEKLSSGLRINKAADDPSGLVISEQMRAQIAGLGAAITNSEKGVSMIQTAEGALDKVQNLLDTMRGLALDSANSATADDKMLAANQAEVTNILQTIDRIASNTQYGTKKLLDGSNALQTTFSGDANGLSSVASADAADGNYSVAVSVVTAGYVSSDTLANADLAYATSSSAAANTLSSGTHTVALSGAYETIARSASALTAPDTVTTTPAGGIGAGASLATDTAALSEGTYTVSLTGALDTVGGFAKTAGGDTVAMGATATYDGSLDGTAGNGDAFTFTNTDVGGVANLATTDAAFTWAGGGETGTASWNHTTGVLTISQTSGTPATYHIGTALTGSITNGESFSVDVTASTAKAQLGADAADAVAFNTASLSGMTDQAVTDGTNTLHVDLSGVTAGNFANSSLQVVKAAATAGAATVNGTLGANSFYTGTSDATYRLTVANDFTAGGGSPTLTADDFTVSQGGNAVATTNTVNGSTVTVAADDGSFSFQFTMDDGDYSAGGTFDVTLGASTAKLTLDGSSAGAATFNSTSTTATAASGTDSVALDVSGATAADLSAAKSASIDTVGTTYQATLSNGSTGDSGTAVAVTAGEQNVTLGDGSTANGGAENTLTVDFGDTLAAGTRNVAIADHSLVFQIGPNKDQTVKISIQDVASDQLAVKADAASGSDLANITSSFGSLADVDITTAQGAQDAIVMIDAAIDEVSGIRGNLGAFQANTLEANLDSLRVASENLQSSESTIRDADMAAEMSTFTKYQIMLQAGTAMLAQANQMPQTLLKLLQG